MIHEVARILQGALDKLSNPKTTMCGSYDSSPDWQQTCDCAMLGGLHRALYDKPWYSPSNVWGAHVVFSVRQLVAKMEGVRTDAIGESRMRRKQADAHRTCTPWYRFELADILRSRPLEIIVPLDEASFKKQAEKSGLDFPSGY